MNLNQSIKAFSEAKQYIPGGVNSPVRAFRSVSVDPPFIKSGNGSKITDIDGNEYIDYVGGYGPLILGHCNEAVKKVLHDAIETGTGFGAPTEKETELAKLICDIVPSVELVRMVNSGTEATMSALRLARGFTGKNKIVKFIGNYHGHSDSLLVKAGSGALTHGVPDSLGVPKEIVQNTITAKYNDLEGIKNIFNQFGDDIAGVIIEPIAGNIGVVAATQEFIDGLREITRKHESLLIFDEVMTGFRVALNGAQSLYNVRPDLTCFGKIIGGGLPVGAYGGRKDIMSCISPVGAVYQAGTLSGNPLAVKAGLATLRILNENPSIYDDLEKKSEMVQEGFSENAKKLGANVTINRVGSMLCGYFTNEAVCDYDTALKSNTEKFTKYFEEMLKQGIYLAPSQFEAGFVSSAHSIKDIEKTIEANYHALQKIVKE